MSAKSPTADQIISLPTGGGALRGIGETFTPDLQTGTGNFNVPIEVPPGRNGFQPQLHLAYSTGNPSGAFGLGWSLTVPGIQRKSSNGVPRYRGGDRDTFVLSGAEDLVPMPGGPPGSTRYRPRTEGLFARILHHHRDGEDYWEVRTRDGLVSIYGTRGAPGPGTELAVVADPDDPGRIFAWRLTETTDPFGNRIEYAYERDEQQEDGPHRWDQLYLCAVRYVDYGSRGNPQYLVQVTLEYEPRPDPFSDYRAGFEIRTTQRCTRIDIRTNRTLSRSYMLTYLPAESGHNAISLLGRIQVTGHDGARTEQLPPLELGYTAFEPHRRRYQPLSALGDALPDRSLAHREFDLVDIFSNGLPGVVQLNGTARYWRNLGGGRLDRPRGMREAPSGMSLADRGVQIADMDGDGRPDLLVTDGERAGYFTFGGAGGWDKRGFHPYRTAPSVGLEDPNVRLLDLEGNGIIGALRTGLSFELYFNDRERGWDRVELRPRGNPDKFPDVSFEDPRVKLAAMAGDGLQSIVLIHQGRIDYWPYLGHGHWGRRITMQNSPRFEDTPFAPFGFDPTRVLLGDVDDDGCADLVHVGTNQVTVWLNQGGNRWSDPILIRGTPRITDLDAVRLANMLGTGPGILWTYDLGAQRDSTYKFLDLTGGTKPYLLSRIDNHMGAVTEIEYAPSTHFYLKDESRPETRWKTTLPFPVHVVARVRVCDEFSRGKLTTDYSYHHGHWDGAEQEFRGFGRVDERDTEVIEVYNEAAGDAFDAVPEHSFSPPTETRTWFHLGPVGPEFGDWGELDFSHEFYMGDPSLLPPPTLPKLERRPLRDAVRSLRGRVLRMELYALDGSERAGRPFTVTEQAHAVNLVADRVYFPHLVGERTTHWERGDDPLTRASFTSGHDHYGLPASRVEISAPRRTSGDRHLTTQTLTTYARRDDAQRYIVDRVARETRYEVMDEGSSSLLALHDTIVAGAARRNVIGQTLSFYDGVEFQGLELGEIGDFGATVRTEALVLTEDALRQAYGAEPPPYLAASDANSWPEEYPQSFQQGVNRAGTGYVFHAGESQSVRGYFARVDRRSYDFHAADRVPRGLVVARLDPRDGRTSITHDGFDLLPASVEDAAGLIRGVTYDYRLLAPAEATDANENRTRFTHSPLGLVDSIAVMGKTGEEVGDTVDQPGTRFVYDFLAGARGQPVSVHTIRREQHLWDLVRSENARREAAARQPLTPAEAAALFPADEVAQFPERFLQSREFSDGFGRLLQTRAQAEDVVFGEPARGDSGLPLDQSADPGEAFGEALAPDDARVQRVAVSRSQVYDNKGRVVEKYEPFFSVGFAYAPPTADQRGKRTTLEYDALSRVVRMVSPDGSEQLIVRGIPAPLSDPASFAPTPWVTFTYDANDNAGRTHPTASASSAHRDTPSSILVDALGRTIESVERLGPRDDECLTTRRVYDIRGNLISMTDPLGRTAFAGVYDMVDRAWRVEQLEAGVRRTVLDAASSVLEGRDSKDALTLHIFDELNRPTRVWARDRLGERVSLRERLVYGDEMDPARNACGRILHHFDEAGLLTYAGYDFKGNVLGESRRVFRDDAILAGHDLASQAGWAAAAFRADWEGAEPDSLLEPEISAYKTSTRYDALNRPVSITYPLAADQTRPEIRPSYDRSGALERIEMNGAAFVERLAYDARGQRVLVAYSNGLMTRYAYQARTFRLGRLRTERFTRLGPLLYRASQTVLQDFGYAYDLMGNMLGLRDRTPGSGVRPHPDALDRAFDYDPLYRLIHATGRECDLPPLPPPWDDAPRCADVTRARAYSEDYLHDAVGNIRSLSHAANGGGFTRTFALVPDSNRLAAVTVAGQPFAYSYDGAGNLSQETTSRHYEWDHNDRLQTFREQAGAGPPSKYVQYLYDHAGRRVKKLVRKGAGLQTTVYIGAGFEHRREARGPTVTESSTIHVLDGAHRLAEVRLGPALGDDKTPRVKYHLADHLGNSNVVTDSGGNVVSREEYTPYGETSFGGFGRKRYRFGGKEREEESSLYYFGARYYASWLARWLSCDPAQGIDGPNLYQYVASNPATFVDPIGLKLTVDNKLVSREADYYTKHAGNPTAKAVLDVLIRSTEQYSRKSESLDFELKVRTNMVGAARELAASRLKFPSPGAEEGKHPLISGTNLKNWETNTVGLRLKQGSTPSVGIRELFASAKKGTLEAECNSAIQLVYYKGILDSTRSDKRFDALFDLGGRYELEISGYDSTSPGALLGSQKHNDYLPGDYRYFENPDYNPKTPAWRGENTLQLPEGFYGHPGGVKSAQEWISFLNRNRGDSAQASASLRDDAQRFWYDLLGANLGSLPPPVFNEGVH